MYYTSPTQHGFINAKKRTNVGKLLIWSSDSRPFSAFDTPMEKISLWVDRRLLWHFHSRSSTIENVRYSLRFLTDFWGYEYPRLSSADTKNVIFELFNSEKMTRNQQNEDHWNITILILRTKLLNAGGCQLCLQPIFLPKFGLSKNAFCTNLQSIMSQKHNKIT